MVCDLSLSIFSQPPDDGRRSPGNVIGPYVSNINSIGENDCMGGYPAEALSFPPTPHHPQNLRQQFFLDLFENVAIYQIHGIFSKYSVSIKLIKFPIAIKNGEGGMKSR